jgi:hypothetical protein
MKIFERSILFGVPVLALVLLCSFSPHFKLVRHTAPGEYTIAGVKFSGPNERKVVSKRFVPAHDEPCTRRTTNHGTAESTCWVDEISEVTLEGYGPVPVDVTCFHRIKPGMIWNNSWKSFCEGPGGTEG